MNCFVYIHFLTLFFCSCFTSYCLAQFPPLKALERAHKHIQDAEQYYADMKYSKAKESYQFAARLYRNNNAFSHYAFCYNGIGNCYINLTHYEDAKNKGFEKALQQLAEIKSIDSNFKIDSSLVADAYEGLGRYYSSISSTLQTQHGQETKIHYTKALEYHQKALRIRQKLYGPLHSKVALSYYFIGQCYRGFPNQNAKDKTILPIQKELEYLKKALAIQLQTIGVSHYQTANSYQALGNYYYEVQKDYHKGFEYHNQAFQIRQALFDKNHLQIAASYVDMAIYYRVMNIYDKELNYLEKALNIQLDILGQEHAQIARSYYLLANRYQNNGSIKKALVYYLSALNILKKLKQEQSLEVAEVHLGLALCYRTSNQHNIEFQQLEKGQKIYEKILGKQHLKMSLVYLEKGNYYLYQKNYDSTLYFYQKAIHTTQEQLGETHLSISTIYDKIAEVYRLTQQPEQELHYLMLSLALRKNKNALRSGSRSLFSLQKEIRNKPLEQELYLSYLKLAEFNERAGHIQQALRYLQKALASVCPSLASSALKEIYTHPSTEELSHNIEWLYALNKKSQLFLKRYKTNSSSKDLTAAINTYMHTIEVINLLRIKFNSSKARQELKKQSTPIYEGAITALYTMYQQTQDEQYLNQAFEVTEYSKSFALLQGLQNTLARGNSNIPNKLLALESRLRRQLAYYSNYENRGDQNSPKFNQLYLTAKQSYDSLILELEKNYPTYYNLKYQTKVTSISKICSLLVKNNHLLLEYFVGDQYIYVFRISKTQRDFFQVPIPKHYEHLIYNLRSSLTNYDIIEKHPQWAYQAFVIASYRVYQQFLAPFLDASHQPQELTIIPDGMLNYIPFEVLISEQPLPPAIKKGQYKDLPFLLKQYPITYNYSATLWHNNSQPNTGSNNGKCLGFAPSIQFSENLDSLPWTQKELEAIESIFEGEYYYGKKANKELFTQIANKFSMIHLATHGIVNMEQPMRSLLSFAPSSDSNNLEQVALYAYEIHNLSLHADLVVLSACETGFGKAIRGEGVLSLARAFLYAGAPSVVTTLWEVNDFTSAALIETFYSNLALGMSKSKALQQAKLTFLSKTDKISGHPAYWASFISIGNSSPIRKVWLWKTIGIFFILVLLLLALGLLYRKKKPSL